MKLTLKKLITPPLPLTLALLSVCGVLWIAFYINGLGLNVEAKELGVISGVFSQKVLKNNLTLYFLNFVLTILNSILIIQLNNKFSIIRTRTVMPILIFNLLLGTWFETHMQFQGHLSVMLVILALFVFFDMYRNSDASEQAFLSTFLIAVSSIFIKPMVLLLPVFWIGYAQFQSLSLRTWLASLIGLITPWIFYFAWALYFQPSLINAEQFSKDFIPVFTLSQSPLYELIYLGAMAVILLIAMGSVFQNLRNDSIQTRATLRFLTIFVFAVSLITLYSLEHHKALMPLIALGYAFLFSHPLSLRLGNFFSIVFILFVLLNFAYVICSLIL